MFSILQAYGGDFKTLSQVVCSLEFISNKCRLGLGNVLLEDYQEKGESETFLDWVQLVYSPWIKFDDVFAKKFEGVDVHMHMSLIFLFKEFSTKSLERDQQKMMGNPRFQEYKMFVSRNIHLLDK